MKLSDIPVVAIGPGSQPESEDGAQLDYMKMPDGMQVYSAPGLPELDKLTGMAQAREKLIEIQRRLACYQVTEAPCEFDVSRLDRENRELLDQVLGDGEVSIIYNGQRIARVQESVLAGVWRIHYPGDTGTMARDTIEIGAVPAFVINHTFDYAESRFQLDGTTVPEGVFNAPSLLVEIQDQIGSYRPGEEAHVINLSLLPMSPRDLEYLQQQLGVGGVTILSRGYGNCRITSTAMRNVWWVQYFNSMDIMILNTIEVVDVPLVARAAQEDIDDSAERLKEIMETCFEPA